MVNRQNGGVAVVHIRYEGRSLDIPQGDLDIGPASSAKRHTLKVLRSRKSWRTLVCFAIRRGA